MKNTLVISAFPATGKTTMYNNMKESGLVVLDSDSSTFDKVCFPANYINHIKGNIGKVDVILVSSHQEVRDAMDEAGIEYYFVLPDKSLKYEWIGRCWCRGNPEGFLKLINDNWDEWTDLDKAWESKAKAVYLLQAGQYLSQMWNMETIKWYIDPDKVEPRFER